MGQTYFLGLEIGPRAATAALLGRDRSPAGAHTQPIAPDAEDDGGFRIDPRKWVRLASDTVRELVESSGIPASKIWGFAPAAPRGWMALDADWNPLTDLRLAHAFRPTCFRGEILRFLDNHPRNRAHCALILAPKDYLRFALSRIIATDTSDAAGLGFLRPGAGEWDGAELAAHSLEARWLPPVLPAAFACGRIGPRGMEALGLSDSAWVAVGSTLAPTRLAGCGFLDAPAVYLSAAEPLLARWHTKAPAGAEAEPGLTHTDFLLSAGRDDIHSEAFTPETPIILDWREEEDPGPLRAWAASTGRPVYAAPLAGRASPGAAVLAALASGAFADREAFFRRFAPALLDV